MLKVPSPNLHWYELVLTTLPCESSATHYQREEFSPYLQLCVTDTDVPDESVLLIELVNEFVKLVEALAPAENPYKDKPVFIDAVKFSDSVLLIDLPDELLAEAVTEREKFIPEPINFQ